MGLRVLGGIREVLSVSQAATIDAQIPLSRFFLDYLGVRFGETALGVSEYLGFRVFDPKVVPRENRRTFASDSLKLQLWEGLNPKDWWVLAGDKLIFHTIMEAAGYPNPKIFAYMDPTGRKAPGIESMDSPQSLAEWLLATNTFPLFLKPAGYMGSHGAMGILGVNAQEKTFELSNGDTIGMAEFLRTVEYFPSYIVQELICSESSLQSITGKGLSTLRLVVLMDDGEPKLFRCRWRIPNRKNMADNFWRDGNIMAEITPATGEVTNILISKNSSFEHLAKDNAICERFVGSTPPLYEAAVKMCLDAAMLYPMMAFQSWDVALTDQGPMLLELNHNGDIEFLQIGTPTGILDDELRQLLKKKGVKLWNPRIRFWRGRAKPRNYV